MNDIEKKYMGFVDENGISQSESKVVIGLSGGPDSVVLFYLSLKYLGKNRIVIAHLDHRFRGDESFSDAMFVLSLAASNSVDAVIRRIDVHNMKNKGESDEEAGRRYRYTLFESVAKRFGAEYVLLAHNSDDQVETVLLNLFRGASVRGLRGMPSIRGFYCRPLISITKKEILRYCEENNFTYCIDKTNAQSLYKRNWIRNVLIPQIRDNLNHSVDNAILRTSENLSSVYSYINDEAKKKILVGLKKLPWGLEMNSSIYCNESSPLRFEILSIICENYLQTSIRDSDMLNRMDSLILTAQSGSFARIIKNWTLVKGIKSVLFCKKELFEFEKLFREILIEMKDLADNNDLIVNFNQYYSIRLSFITPSEYDRGYWGLDFSSICGDLYADYWRHGDRMKLKGERSDKKLKDLFNERKIEPWIKILMPVLRDDSGIIFTPYIGVDIRCAVRENEPESILYVELLENDNFNGGVSQWS